MAHAVSVRCDRVGVNRTSLFLILTTNLETSLWCFSRWGFNWKYRFYLFIFSNSRTVSLRPSCACGRSKFVEACTSRNVYCFFLIANENNHMLQETTKELFTAVRWMREPNIQPKALAGDSCCPGACKDDLVWVRARNFTFEILEVISPSFSLLCSL